MVKTPLSNSVRSRAIDRKAIASFSLAMVAVLTAQFWIIATAVSIAAVSLALASRRSVRMHPELRGTTLGLAGFLIAAGVLVFATVGRSLLTLFLFTIAPPAA